MTQSALAHHPLKDGRAPAWAGGGARAMPRSPLRRATAQRLADQRLERDVRSHVGPGIIDRGPRDRRPPAESDERIARLRTYDRRGALGPRSLWVPRVRRGFGAAPRRELAGGGRRG